MGVTSVTGFLAEHTARRPIRCTGPARLAVETCPRPLLGMRAGMSLARRHAMFHLFHLGPLILDNRKAWIVGAIDEHGGLVPPIHHEDLGTALKLMVDDFRHEEPVLEPALAAFAPGLGVPVAPRPGYLDDAPAVLAFSTVNAHEDLPRGTGIRAFLDACLDFGAVAPWDRFPAHEPLPVQILARNRRMNREALVLGGNGEPVGLALCDRRGAGLRCLAALREGDSGPLRKLDAITLAFSTGPEWALRAVRTAVALPEFPFVFRGRRGAVGPTTEVELGALAVTLGAVALLASESSGPREPAESVLDIDGHEYRAIVFPPESSSPLPRTAPGDSRGRQPKVRGRTARTRGPRLLQSPRREDLN